MSPCSSMERRLFIAAACLLWASPIPFLSGFVLPNRRWQFSSCSWLAGCVLEAGLGLGVPLLGRDICCTPRCVRDFYGRQTGLVSMPRSSPDLSSWLCRRLFLASTGLVSYLVCGVCVGSRFFPRYYFLAACHPMSSGVRGFFLLRRNAGRSVFCLTIIPILRFGPRTSVGLGDRYWSDLALMNDSRRAASIVRESHTSGDRMLVWGYRPDIFVCSGLPAATRLSRFTALNGVFADRHLDIVAARTVLSARNFLRIEET